MSTALHISIPSPGFYRTRLAKGGVWVPVLVYRPCPMDPEDGYPLDRYYQLRCLVDGKEVGFARVINDQVTDKLFGFLAVCCNLRLPS